MMYYVYALRKPDKLTYDDVVQIKWGLAAGVTMTRLGRLFGVSRKNIAEIRTGKTWFWISTALTNALRSERLQPVTRQETK